MSRKFSRNITGAKIKGENKEPLRTNSQNDLLSDGEDVAIRNNNEYHILTDSIKEVRTNDKRIKVRNYKNHVTISLDLTDIEERLKSLEG